MEKILAPGNSRKWQDILNEVLGTNEEFPMKVGPVIILI